MKSTVACLFLATAVLSLTHGRTLISDTFNDSMSKGSEDVNHDLLGGRQSGDLAPIKYYQGVQGTGTLQNEADKAYRTQVDNAGNADSLWLVGELGEFAAVSPNYNFNHGIGPGELLVIRLTIDPSDNGGWGGLTFGASDNAKFGLRGAGARGQFFLGNYAYFGFLLDSEGTFKAFENGMQVDAKNLPSAGTHRFTAVISGDGRGAPFDGMGSAMVEVYVDDDPTPLIAHRVASDFQDNYISLLGFGDGFDIQAFDNLEVKKVDIPESGVCVAMAGCLSGLFVLVRRRRE